MADEEREILFDKLMEAYQNDVLRLCYGMLGNMTDAEDALQGVEKHASISREKQQFRIHLDLPNCDQHM